MKIVVIKKFCFQIFFFLSNTHLGRKKSLEEKFRNNEIDLKFGLKIFCLKMLPFDHIDEHQEQPRIERLFPRSPIN